MSEAQTAQAEAKVRPYSFIGSKDMSISSADPRMVRWGINPGSFDCNPPILETGISPIPVGHPFPITTFSKQIENCTTDENAARTISVEVTAETAERHIGMFLRQLGFKTFAIGMTDEDLMALYKQALLPDLTEIGIRCPATDEADLGVRSYCPQCLYQFLTGEDVDARIKDFAKKNETFAVSQALELKNIFIAAYAEYLLTAREQWNGIVRDYETGQQTQIHALQHALRKAIHETKPADKQLKLVEGFTRAQGEQNSENTMAILAYMDEQNAKRDKQMMEFMAGIFERITPAPPAEKKGK